MQEVSGNVGPKLTKHVSKGVTSYRGGIPRSQPFASVVLVRVVAGRYAWYDAETEGVRSAERAGAVVPMCSESVTGGVGAAFPEASLAKDAVTLTLRCDRQERSGPAAPVVLIDGAARTVLSGTTHASIQLLVRVGSIGSGGRAADEDERRIAGAVRHCKADVPLG